MSKNDHNMIKMALKLKSVHTFTFSKSCRKESSFIFYNETILTLFLPFLDISTSVILTEKIKKWQKNDQDGLKLKKLIVGESKVVLFF